GPGLYVTLMHKRWPKVEPVALPELQPMTAPFCSGEFPLIFLSSHQTNWFLREALAVCPKVEFRAHHLPELTVRLGVGSTRSEARVADRLRAEILRMGEDGELGDILSRYAYVGLTEARTVLQLIAAERQSRKLTLALSGLAVALAILVWLAW